MIIPVEDIDPDVLVAIIESYVTRDGTDYGEYELSLAQKVQELLPKVKRQEILVVFDPETESVTLLTPEQLHSEQQ